MRHDYKNVRRGAVQNSTGKTRVTMYLDDDVLQHFREKALVNGRGYQTEINAHLRQCLSREKVVVHQDVSMVHISGVYTELKDYLGSFQHERDFYGVQSKRRGVSPRGIVVCGGGA